MSRSSKKGVYVDEKLMMKAQKAKQKNDRRPIKTWSRRSTITPDFVGLTFAVHNGKVFNNVFVSENMVGHKLGEFSPTRTFRKHSTSQDKAKALAGGAKT
jgi:small subunit ribosomal protein S19